MNKIFFLFLLLSFHCVSFEQEAVKIDSLKTELGKQNIPDSSMIHLYLDLSTEYRLFSKSKALNYTDHALALAKKTDNRKLELDSYLYSSLVYFFQEEIDSSLVLSNKALEFANTFPELENEKALVYDHIGHAYFFIGNYNKALNNFSLALAMEERLNHLERVSVMENKVGNCYSYLHEWEKAMQAFQHTISICESLDNKTFLADVYVNMGTIKDDMGEDALAKEYYLKALEIYEGKNNQSGMSSCYTNLGDFYCGEGEHLIALEYFTKSLMIDRELKDDYGICIDVFNIAEVHLALGDTTQAFWEYKRSLQMATESGYTQMIAYNSHALGIMALDQGKSTEAISYGLKSLAVGKIMDNPETILSSCKLLTDAYKSLGQYKKAFDCLSEYQLLYDSIFNAEKSQQIIEISTKYETAEKEKQNAILEARNTTQQKKQNILIIILFISVLFMAFVFLLWFQRKKTLNKLSRQKQYFEGLIENSEDFIIIVDAKGKTKYLSSSYSRKMGWSNDDRIGQNPMENVHPDDINNVQKVHAEVLAGKKNAGCEFRLKDASGNWHWMTSKGKNLMDDPEINGIIINFWDISKRKINEKLIEESREELSKSQVFARIGSWQLNLDTQKLIVSKELAILINYGSEEVSIDLNDFINNLVIDDDKEILIRRFEESAENFNNIGYSDRFQVRIKTDNTKGFIITELWGNIIAPGIIKGVTQDITDKVEAEQKIIDSEKSYRELFDNAFDAIYILNSKGEFIDVNKGAIQMYDYPKSYFIGKTPEFLSAPGKNNLADVQAKVMAAYDGVASQIEFWGIDKEGRVFPKVTKLTPGYYFGKKVVIAFAMDISELFNTQQEVVQKEKEYRRIYNAFPDIYFKSSYNGSVLDVSPSAEAISGFKLNEIIGKPSNSFYYLEEDYIRLGKLLVESGSIKDVDFKLRVKGNKFLDCSFSGSIIRDENGEPIEVEGVIRDISLRVKTLKKLVESEKKLKEANLTKDKVFSIISHDLRGPISTNKSIVDLIVNEFEKISKEDIFKLLDSYKPTADATFFLLENLLSWSRGQLGQISFNPGLNPINSIVQENMELYSSQAQFKDIQLINTVQPDLIGFFDKTMLDITVRNLISNALKFTPHKGKVEIKSSLSGNFIYISVTDTGVGINKSHLKKIFKDSDNNKITSTGTDNEKGAGLGLVLCKEFVELNGGEISVVSIEGEGSTFVFSVPLYKY